MSCVIFGAGKIARGFIGHLLYLSGIPFTFVEKSEELVSLVNSRGEYTVNILGAPEKSCVVKGAKAIPLSDGDAVADAVAGADAVFTAVGGKNLSGIVPALAEGVGRKSETGGTLNIVTCENWKEPAEILRRGVAERLEGPAAEYFAARVGVSEAVILRSGIDASPEQLSLDPLWVNAQNYWELPVDSSRLRGELPPIKGLKLIPEFTGFLERKFYTYNAANGTVSYLGALLGYTYIADAAHDERILEILEGVYSETARALSLKHAFPLGEQMAFTRTSLAKLQDYTITDYIERNARDPMRKLGPDDRLVGSARLALSYGIVPENLARAAAAAIYYRSPEDESAVRLEALRRERGVDAVLREVCGLDPEGELGLLIKDKIAELKARGWIKEGGENG